MFDGVYTRKKIKELIFDSFSISFPIPMLCWIGNPTVVALWWSETCVCTLCTTMMNRRSGRCVTRDACKQLAENLSFLLTLLSPDFFFNDSSSSSCLRCTFSSPLFRWIIISAAYSEAPFVNGIFQSLPPSFIHRFLSLVAPLIWLRVSAGLD